MMTSKPNLSPWRWTPPAASAAVVPIVAKFTALLPSV